MADDSRALKPDTEPLDWTYETSTESTDLVSIGDRYGVFVDGDFRPPLSKSWDETINPATEEPLATVPVSGERDVDRAVSAARKAFASWSRLDPSTRAKYLYRIARMVQERSRELAVLETLDGGKPIRESRDVD
ncbi:MAG: aldehyde dehydrogenase family protein, partial [Acidimicrobiia bacterium]|nr:aldehyde dehydrogenase family protein [Acidimicrobiia bacterium]